MSAPRCTCGAGKANGKRVESHRATCPLAPPPPPPPYVEAFAGSTDAKAFDACRLIGLLERDTRKLPMPIGDDPRPVLRWNLARTWTVKMSEPKARKELALAVGLWRELERIGDSGVERKIASREYTLEERGLLAQFRRYRAAEDVA